MALERTARSVLRLSLVCLAVPPLVADATETGNPAAVSARAPVEVVADGFEEPVGIVVHPGGDVFVSDRRAGVVFRVAPGTGAVQTVAANLRRPAGLAFSPEGDVLIAEERAGRLLRLTPDGALGVLARGLEKPRWLAVAEDGTTYVSAAGARSLRDQGDGDRVGEVILRLLPGGGHVVVASGFKGLEGIAVHGTSLFAAARGRRNEAPPEGAVYRLVVDADGSPGPITRLSQADIASPAGLVRDALGALYVTAREGALDAGSPARVYKILPDGSVNGFAEGLLTARGLALDGSGNLYAADGKGQDGRLLRFLAPPAPALVLAPSVNQRPLIVEGTTETGSRVDALLNGVFLPAVAAPDGAFELVLDLAVRASNSLTVFSTGHGGLGLTAATDAEVVHDDVPPEISGLQPADGSFAAVAAPPMAASFADGLSGVDVAGVEILLDGANVTADALVTESAFALAVAVALSEGVHRLEVRAADRAGNVSSAGSDFVVDVTPPVISGLRPSQGDTVGTRPLLGADFGDALSGIDVASALILLDGADLTSLASVTPAGFTVELPVPLAEGPHALTVLVQDRAGHSATASSSFAVLAPPAVVARVKITPAAALLTTTGETRLLSAQAYDATGRPMPAVVTWTSSRPDVIHVDGEGRITAGASVGSAQIVAEAGGMASAPTMVVVARPVPGAMLVRDAQVVSPPEAVDPETPFDVGTRSRTTLRDVVAPAVGTIVLGTEEIPVGGRVVAVEESDGLVTVTLEAVPIADLVTDLVIDETIDLSGIEPEIPEEVRAYFTVTRSVDGTLEFIPTDETVVAMRASAQDSAQPAPSATFTVGPFECESSVVFPLANITLGTMSVTQNLDADLVYDSSAGGLQRLAIKGDVTGRGAYKLTLTSAVQGTVECKLELATVPVPLPFPLRLVLKPEVALGIGGAVSGTVTVTSLGIEPSVEAKVDTEVGLSCPGGQSCTVLRSVIPTVGGALDFRIPSLSNPTAQFRLEPEMSVFVFAAFEDSGPLLTTIGLKTVLEAKGGLKEAASLATVEGQLAASAYQSDYKLNLEASAGLGAGAEKVVRFFQVSVTGELKLETILLLARSPAAASVTSDRASFASGDAVRFTVTLDPSTLTFPIPGTALPALVYNVKEIRIFQKKRLAGGGFEPVLIASQAATSGQQRFFLQGTAVQASTQGPADPFHAFVVTTFLPLPLIGDLELGPAPASPQPPMTLRGAVSLQSRETFPQVHASLFEDTRITASVVVDMVFDIEGGVEATVRQASGTGSYTAGADLTGCGRAPETKTGSVIGGSLAFDHVSDQPELHLRFSGTSISTTCDGSTARPFQGSLPDGELKGTPVLLNGFLVAINFSRTTTSGNRTTITSGALTP